MFPRVIGGLLLLRTAALLVILLLLVVFVNRLLDGMSARVDTLNARLDGVRQELAQLGGGEDNPGGLLRLRDSAYESETFMANLPEFELDIQPITVNLGIIGEVEIPIPFAQELNEFSADFNNLVTQLEDGFGALGDVSDDLHDITLELRDASDEINAISTQIDETVRSLRWVLLAFAGVIGLWLLTSILDDGYRGWRLLRGHHDLSAT